MWIYTEQTVLKIFSTFNIFEQLVLALKNRVFLEIFHCIEYTFYIQDFWATSLALKNRVALKFSLYWAYIFIIQEFWVTCDFFKPGGLPLPPPRTPMSTELINPKLLKRISTGCLGLRFILTHIKAHLAMVLQNALHAQWESRWQFHQHLKHSTQSYNTGWDSSDSESQASTA